VTQVVSPQGLILLKSFRYYFLGDYRYWVMDATIGETDLINRARLDGKGPADGFDA
jgi:hypothetical protein